ncbi:copper chaperone PCu(A)C [Paracoccus panacisoli]|uniref:Copper chaperone PCu(A)C n=1 Tax=Paracoccus panacisoli TaxID=1510163 RepID=A0ABV6T522_9RHOB
MTRTFLTAAALAAILPFGALTSAATAQTPAAAPAAPSVLTITDAYARSTNPDVGAAFMTIANAGTTDCQLTGLTAEGFDAPELHTHLEEGGVMKMVKVDAMTIPAGGTHSLERGGDHIMLMKPKAPVAQGQVVAMTLDFGACGTVPLSVTIDNNAGPKGPAMGMGGMGGMGQMHHDHMMHGGMAPSN